MWSVFLSSWALLLGMSLLMLGNGMIATLLGIRGGLEEFSTLSMSFVVAGYFLGFFFASRMVPAMIRKVGHVRVFAALGSFVSAALILFPALADPVVWVGLRCVLGFCFCGLYITAESWLNNSATNETRGQAMSLYMIVQMAGIVGGQALLGTADPAGWYLFVIPTVLVSLAFAPILLTISPTPAFETTKPMRLGDLYEVSPLGIVGMFLMGGVFAAQFGMASVYGYAAEFSVAQVSTFVAAIYLGGMTLQYPIGWISDRMDRRILILIIAFCATVICGLAYFVGNYYTITLVCSFFMGGLTNPLYALLIAYTNDRLEPDDMAAASGGLLFVNAIGAIIGPFVTGWFMEYFGPQGFWIMLTGVMGAMAAYAFARMFARAAPAVEDTSVYVAVTPVASPVAVEAAGEWAAEYGENEES